ncbi:putative colanic acid biosynthesis acetyltransferase [Uliginosibacterium gangwonense]|uniref:putative colanic acid biosynthesis acetyltransferase n=1 Tax=Uliginosibacterium gangwonense TaxID=392736 RepID=UPI00036FF89B|nr:putative colanic acid biosynthesis acetyltransferase [Uliginosibacterium gangwonense]
MQDLAQFELPVGFRGRGAVLVQLWWIVQATFFRCSPQFAYRFRAWLLRLFGARVGRGTVIRPTVRITYPWKVSIGDHVWIGDDAELYSLGEIEIGAHVVVSQRSYLCAADHDYAREDFCIRAKKIVIEEQAWVAADVFVAPGVRIGKGAVIGARSSVFKDMPESMVCVGSPCQPVRPRVMEG